MVIDVKKHIGQILYERDSLIIPNLGGFVSTYKPAAIDHVQGMIQPPSKKLGFNKNLIINDGILINCIQEALGVTLTEAQKAIKDFVSRTIEMLDNREIILFPGVGRLYKDYENNIQFLQDNTNYNTKVYGLPTLQFYPILRARPAGSLSSDTAIPQQSASKSFNLRRTATAIMPFALIAIIMIGSFMFFNRTTENADIAASAMPVKENRMINKKPSVEQMSIVESLANTLTKSEPVEEEPELIVEESTDIRDTESATLSPGAKECVIIIGAFGKKAGVEKRVGQIIDLGYSVYQDKKGKLTRVGIQFAYQDEEEIKDKLDAMRDNFDNRAWVLTE